MFWSIFSKSRPLHECAKGLKKGVKNKIWYENILCSNKWPFF
ncbi:hypothetical protein BREVNS_1810 [Brevinematales bacterium NS]|nr:hypothetical protein BREVNS_1810 [Brevinematales bacterium NS]